MQITDILARDGRPASIARELGISEAQATSGAAALVPAILGGFKKQAQAQPAGLEGLGGLLGQLGGGGLLDNVLAPQPTDVSRGNDVLGQIFGSKDVSRTVAQNAASQSGLDPGPAEEDAADAGDDRRGLHGEAGRRRARRRPGAASEACWAGCSAGSRDRAAPGAGAGSVDARPQRRRQCARRHPADGRQGVSVAATSFPQRVGSCDACEAGTQPDGKP